MRRHKDPTKCPKQKTTQAQQTEDPQAEDTPSPEDNPSRRQLKHRRPPQPRQSPQPPQARGRCTRYVALHPLRGGAPVTWRCTRTEEVHCLRIGCSAPTNKNKRGTGTPNHSPPHPSMRTWALLAAGWARRPRHHLHSGPLRPNPTPPTPLHAKSRLTPPTAPRRTGSEPIARQAGQPAGFSETSARTRLGPSAVARMPRYWGRHAKQPMVRWSCAGVRLRHVMSMSVGVGLAVVMT